MIAELAGKEESIFLLILGFSARIYGIIQYS